MFTIGIDPGVTGAIAVLQQGVPVLVESFPIVITAKAPRKKKGKTVHGKRTELDYSGVAERIKYISTLITDSYVCLLERVGAMPRDSTTSAFCFGASFGAIKMALAANNISYSLVQPRMWQKYFLGAKNWNDARELKERYFAVANTAFPQLGLTSIYKDSGRAAAVLIADYAKNKFDEMSKL